MYENPSEYKGLNLYILNEILPGPCLHKNVTVFLVSQYQQHTHSLEKSRPTIQVYIFKIFINLPEGHMYKHKLEISQFKRVWCV